MEKSVRKLAALASLLIFVLLGATPAAADDAAVIAEVNSAVAALDAAFERGEADEIRKAMTNDHLSVTPYYDGPQQVDAQIASLGDLKFSQTVVGEPKVILLGPEAALRIFTAEFAGTYRGQEMPHRQFVTSVLVKRDGRWLERLYQATTLKP